MGHFFVVHGDDPRSVDATAAQASKLFETLHGAKATHRYASDDTHVQKFARRQGRSSRLRQAVDGKGWACGSGSWFDSSVDPDEVLGRIADHGCSAPASIDGSFALAFRHAGEPGFGVVTDRVGTIHVYFRARAGTCLVSTSSLVLAALDPVTWDLSSVAEFLGTGTVFENRTLFQGIHKLDRASVYRIHAGGSVAKTRYWELGGVAFDSGDRVGTVEDLADALVSGVRLVERVIGEPMVDLTGGYDSRAVLGAALRSGCRFRTVVNGPPDNLDVVAANAIAGSFGLDHVHQKLPAGWSDRWWGRAKEALALCDGEYDILEYARTLENHSRLATAHGVSVNGSGGEFSKGYWWELLFPHTGSKGHFDARRVASQRFATDGSSRGLLAVEPEQGLAEHFASVIERESVGLDQARNTALMDNVYFSLRMQRWQGRIASATNQIWPCVSPFMFREPLEIALSSPPRARSRNRMSRELNEFLNPELAAKPLAQGYPALPIRLGTLHLFAPLAKELAAKVMTKGLGPVLRRVRPAPSAPSNADLERLLDDEEVRDHLDPTRMLTRDLYVPGRLRAIVARNDTRAPERLIGRVLTLERLARVVGESSAVR